MTFLGIASGATLNAGKELDRRLDAIAEANSDGVRVSAQWERIQPQMSGGFDWSSFDPIVAGCENRGLTLCAGLAGRDNHTFNYPDAYSRAFAAVAERYEGRIGWLEAVNEPDHFICDANPTPARYVVLQKKSFEAAKKAAPTVKISTGGLGGMKADWAPKKTAADFWAECYKAGIKGYMDVAAFHPYSQPGTFAQSVTNQKRGAYLLTLARNTSVVNGDKSLPWILTEYGWQTGGNRTPISEKDQASRILESYQWITARSWISAAFYFNFQDQATADLENPGDWMGLIRSDGTAKPALAVFSACAALGSD